MSCGIEQAVVRLFSEAGDGFIIFDAATLNDERRVRTPIYCERFARPPKAARRLSFSDSDGSRSISSG